MSEKAFERNAWILLFIVGAGLLLAAAINGLAGHPLASGLGFVRGNLGMSWDELAAADPDVARMVVGFTRMAMVFAFAYAVVFLVVIATSYRAGRRWAWWAAWSCPAVLLGYAAVATTYHGWGRSGWKFGFGYGFVALAILGLLLPIRHFFPKD